MQRTPTTIGLILGGVLLFVAGVAAGWRSGQAEPPVAGELSDAPPSQEVSARAATSGPRLEASVARADVDPASPRGLERLALLTELNRRLRTKFALSPVNFDQKLNDDFVRLFDVTPAERQEFESAIATAYAELAQAAASVARIVPQADGSFTISIPSFPEEGGRIYDQLMARETEIMGPERTAYMREMKILDEDQTWQFDRFGIMQTTVELNPAAPLQNHWFIHVDDKTGLTTRTARLDLLSFRQKYPAIYENMRATGLLRELPVP